MSDRPIVVRLRAEVAEFCSRMDEARRLLDEHGEEGE